MPSPMLYVSRLFGRLPIDPYLQLGDVLSFHDALAHQHLDYGRGSRGVIEDHLLDNPCYRMLQMPVETETIRNEANTLAVLECVRLAS